MQKLDKTIFHDYGGNECLLFDVGWAGFYWLFGAFSTVGLIILINKSYS